MTDFDTIIDLALITVNDHRIAKIYNKDTEGFQEYVDGFLKRAVPYFTDCKQNLSYDADNRYFDADLTPMEQSILADLWVIEWLVRDNNTYALYRQHLQNSGSFKNHSEAQNLKEFSAQADKMREELNRKLTDYQLSYLS